MKVVLLGCSKSSHITKWANGLSLRGIEVILISVHNYFDYELSNNVRFYVLKPYAPWGFFFAIGKLRKILKETNPDLLNAHYATSYGLLARLSKFKPLLLSVWGSDVYDFPTKSIFHKLLLKANLKSATAIASTSECMLTKTLNIYNHKKSFVTPFGIDEKHFSPCRDTRDKNENKSLIIGTVKGLSYEYGIDILLEAFSLIIKSCKDMHHLKLEITGYGLKFKEYYDLAFNLGISDKVIFHGKVSHKDVPRMLNRLDIYVALSRMESFGVSILEASACELPVVVSDADGPKEVVLNGITGIIVPKNEPRAAADAIIDLIQNQRLRNELGKAGRDYVLKNYTWDKSLDIMTSVIKQTVENS